MRYLLLLTLMVPGIASGQAISGTNPSPNSGTITPAAITTGDGSFSGSVTASSVTSLGGGFGVKGGQGFAASPSGYGSIYGLSGQGLTLQGETGSTNQFSLLEAGGNGYWAIGRNPHFYLIPGFAAANVAIGYAAGAVLPQKLSVSGSADITENLYVAGSTFTVATTGIVSAPSQPAIRASAISTDNNLPSGSVSLVEFGTDVFNKGGVGHNISASSGTFTVPTGAGGIYHVECLIVFQAGGGTYRYVEIFKGAESQVIANTSANASLFGSTSASAHLELAAGDAIQCKAYQDSGADMDICNAGKCFFSMVKLW